MQKGVNKDVHLVVDFHGHAIHEKGVNPLMSQKLDDVCRGPTSLGGFILLDFP